MRFIYLIAVLYREVSEQHHLKSPCDKLALAWEVHYESSDMITALVFLLLFFHSVYQLKLEGGRYGYNNSTMMRHYHGLSESQRGGFGILLRYV